MQIILRELDISPLLLMSEVTVAAPIRSNGDYTLTVNIWDKKGKGSFRGKLDFEVVPNDKILIDVVNVSFNEVYIYSKERSRVSPDNVVKFEENTYFIFEGLTGFKEENGLVYPGLRLKGIDSKGNVILDYDDLFADYTETGLSVTDFNSRVASNFILTGTEFNNPFHCEVTIWDKKSDAKITSTADLVVKQ